MPRAADPKASANLSGGAWLIADMSLNIFALTIVKALGLGYPALQIVFLRAAVGLVLILPWACYHQRAFQNVPHLPLHILRVALSTLALATSFFAIARLPFALVTAIGFTRPIVTMVLALLLLHEPISRRRWIAAAIAFVGVVIAVNPSAIPVSWGLGAAMLTVLFGTLAIIVTRHLSDTPVVLMMTIYTLGLTLFSAPFAYMNWTPLQPSHVLPLLAIGLFAQSAQFCFLNAHKRAEAGFLSILAYLSLLLTTAVGYFAFAEIPTVAFGIGAIMIIAAAMWTTLTAR